VRRWCAAALLVSIGWLASPQATPIYDGVGAPDERYRYALMTPAPDAATATVPLTAGTSGALQLKSSESGPQVLIDVASGAFRGSGTALTVTASPLPATGTPPRGAFDSNLYRVTASGDAALRPDNAQGFLFLRAAIMTSPNPVIVHRTDPQQRWTEVKTSRAGRDVLSTPLRGLGDYAVERPPNAKSLSTANGLSLTRGLLLGGGIVLLLAITILALRRPSA
jgi:hypothetical protein